MSFFNKFWQAPQDKTREVFCAHLRSLGIEARMAPRGLAQENIYTGPRRSLGVINIAKGPIPWGNIIRATNAVGTDDYREMPYYLVYGVPDTRIGPGFPRVRVKAMKTDRGWWARLSFVQVDVGVRWEGEDYGLGIVQHLNRDLTVAKAIKDGQSWELVSEVNPRDGPLEIRAYRDSCWILTVKDALTPSKQEWDCYQSIASHLLAMPVPIRKGAAQ